MRTPPKILIIRNDKLGDFMLAWPGLALLRKALPDAQIHALVPAYTRPLAAICPYLDASIEDPGRGSSLAGFRQLTATLRTQRYDAVITLFSTARIAAAVFAARIPYRLAPATKLAQLGYNRREIQRRSRSEKPEWLYNVELVRRFLHDWGVACPATPEPPYLVFNESEIDAARHSFYAQHQIPASHQLVFIHPGSGGSANNLRPGQFADLAQALNAQTPVTFVVSSGPGERALAEELAIQLRHRNLPVRVYVSTEGLVEFARQLRLAHVFISGSTGPLHIAGALNIRTVGFYPRKRSSTILRWQTLSEDARRLAFAPPETTHETDMLSVDIEAAAARINEHFLRPASRGAA